jgi:anti-anti-sigma regulatory factor
VCIYQASSPEAIHRHATAADLPVDEVIQVASAVAKRDAVARRACGTNSATCSTPDRVASSFTDAEFIDSSVLQALVDGQARAAENPEDTLAIVAPSGGLPRRLITLTALDKLIPTYEARAEALADWNDT